MAESSARQRRRDTRVSAAAAAVEGMAATSAAAERMGRATSSCASASGSSVAHNERCLEGVQGGIGGRGLNSKNLGLTTRANPRLIGLTGRAHQLIPDGFRVVIVRGSKELFVVRERELGQHHSASIALQDCAERRRVPLLRASRHNTAGSRSLVQHKWTARFVVGEVQ
jgi:hypothetical protein